MKIGKRLREIRLRQENECRWPSALQLSLAAGLGKNAVAFIERGGEPKIETIRALAKTLGVSVSELIGESKHVSGVDQGAL